MITREIATVSYEKSSSWSKRASLTKYSGYVGKQQSTLKVKRFLSSLQGGSMKKLVLFLLLATFLGAAAAQAASIQYIDSGRKAPKVKISFSKNNGASWEYKEVSPGQTYTIPKNATHLRIDNVPYEPSKNYKIKDGNVF